MALKIRLRKCSLADAVLLNLFCQIRNWIENYHSAFFAIFLEGEVARPVEI